MFKILFFRNYSRKICIIKYTSMAPSYSLVAINPSSLFSPGPWDWKHWYPQYRLAMGRNFLNKYSKWSVLGRSLALYITPLWYYRDHLWLPCYGQVSRWLIYVSAASDDPVCVTPWCPHLGRGHCPCPVFCIQASVPSISPPPPHCTEIHSFRPICNCRDPGPDKQRGIQGKFRNRPKCHW